MNDAEGSITRPSWRSILFALLLAPFLCVVLWECGHRIRFGDFFTYGYHTDLVEDHSDIGVPRQHTAYCLRVTNYTLFALKFEGHQWPMGGTMDGGISYHDRLEKWDQQSRSWSTVFDHVEGSEPSTVHANTAKTVGPGQSIYPTGCYEVATVEGIQAGDMIRIIAFTSYSSSTASGGQHAFYSRAFVVNEKSAGDQHKSRTDTSAMRPRTTVCGAARCSNYGLIDHLVLAQPIIIFLFQI